MTPRTRQDPPTRRCERCGQVHERCSGHRSSTGAPCRRWPKPGTGGPGVGVCATHGARAPQVRRAAERRVAREAAEAEGRRLLDRLGGSLDIDPLDALLGQVREAAANVEVLRAYVSELGVDVAHDGAIAIPEQTIEFERGGTHVPAAQHVLVAMYNEERDRLVKYAKLCLDAGVEERRVRVAEQDAQRLGRAFAAALDDVADLLTDRGRAALRQALGRRLRELAA